MYRGILGEENKERDQQRSSCSQPQPACGEGQSKELAGPRGFRGLCHQLLPVPGDSRTKGQGSRGGGKKEQPDLAPGRFACLDS